MFGKKLSEYIRFESWILILIAVLFDFRRERSGPSKRWMISGIAKDEEHGFVRSVGGKFSGELFVAGKGFVFRHAVWLSENAEGREKQSNEYWNQPVHGEYDN